MKTALHKTKTTRSTKQKTKRKQTTKQIVYK